MRRLHVSLLAWLGLAMLLAALPARAVNEADLLEPDKAFRISARLVEPDSLEVRYRIADGYYLYRDKFKFVAENGGVKLGAAQFPPGLVHDDKFFGKMETYRKDLRIRIPVEAPA